MTISPSKSGRFEVFYDAQCPLCKKEIDMVRRMDVNDRLILTDIAADEFQPSTVGKSLDTLMREIHGRHEDGSWVVGVEVFREIYGRVGFEKLTALSRWPIVKSMLDLGYMCFAWPRYRLALRRMRKAGTDSTGRSNASTCELESSSRCQQIGSMSEPVSSASTVD
jgi:predicted DCC family thiol-disulfide oxidoreductase YuxK